MDYQASSSEPKIGKRSPELMKNLADKLMEKKQALKHAATASVWKTSDLIKELAFNLINKDQKSNCDCSK